MTARLALSPDQIEDRWPKCRASVVTDFGYRVIIGRIVGRTTEKAQRFDVRCDDGALYQNIPAARVFLQRAAQKVGS